MEYSVTVPVHAPPAAVWRVVSDITRIGEFSPETFAAEWIDGADGPVVGARFRGHVKRNQNGPTYWSTCEMTECEPDSSFGFAVLVGGRPINNWRYEFRPADAGTTEVTESGPAGCVVREVAGRSRPARRSSCEGTSCHRYVDPMDARDPDALHDVDLPVFFFGTFMHERVLRSNGIDHGPTTPARLVGHRLTIRPRVNVVADAGHVTYGALAALSPGELDSLYGALRRDVGVSYDPVGVRVRLTDGTERDAWCYVSPGLDEGDPDPAYLSELIECARDVGAPPEYLEHIASFGG